MRARKATVVGGGIAGLAAALRLKRAGIDVDLLDGSDRLGGKIRTGDDRPRAGAASVLRAGGTFVAEASPDAGAVRDPAGPARASGVSPRSAVEAGAEAFLMRDPDGGPSAAVRLVEELGLGGDIVHPTGLVPGLFVNGALRPMPSGTLLGIPGPQTDLTGVATLSGSDVDTGRPVIEADVAVGKLVRQRFGDDVVTKLVDPLLGGVYAGRADGLSLAATMPALYARLRHERTLSGAVARTIEASRAHSAGGPVFGTIRGGLSRLIEAAARELGDAVQLRSLVRELPPGPVVLALPGPKATRLLPEVGLGGMEYASVALATFEFPDSALELLPDMSGLLVPESEGLSIKAATFFSKKWAHIDGCVVRVSLGRAGQAAILQAPDQALIQVALDDLSKVVGDLPAPRSVRLDRWGGGLPQYPRNHMERVEQARARLRDRPIALAGAAFDGVGIPACVKSGNQAAQLLLERWLT